MVDTIDATTRFVVFPKEHLGLLIAQYLYDSCVLDAQTDKISTLNIPVDVDDEGLITIKVGLVEGWKVEAEGATLN